MPLPTTQAQSLAEALPAEMARCRELLAACYEFGTTGVLGPLALENSLTRAEAALASGDQLAMLRSYQELKDHE